jgi:ABC-type sugar transport system ATPase subunit
MTQTKPMIEARGLDKFYGSFQALTDISITVNQGERW